MSINISPDSHSQRRPILCESGQLVRGQKEERAYGPLGAGVAGGGGRGCPDTTSKRPAHCGVGRPVGVIHAVSWWPAPPDPSRSAHCMGELLTHSGMALVPGGTTHPLAANVTYADTSLTKYSLTQFIYIHLPDTALFMTYPERSTAPLGPFTISTGI